MYISNNNSVNISFSFNKNKVAKVALLDCGMTNNFIDQQAVKCLNIITHPLLQPCILYNVDRTENKSGQITRYVDLKIIRGLQI